MLENLRTQGSAYGLKFGELGLLANTHKALLVSEYAKTVQKDKAYADAMLSAYFSEAKNIGLEKVIIEIAESVGITASEVNKAFSNPEFEAALESNLETGHKLNIRSVPTFIVNGQQMVVGAQSQDTFRNIFNTLASGGTNFM